MRYAAVAIAVSCFGALGIHDALRASRLSGLRTSGEAQAKLNAMLPAFSGWAGTTEDYSEKALRSAGAIAFNHKLYRGGADLGEVRVLIFAGSPGDLGAHDPERCYGATGYKSLGRRIIKEVDDGTQRHTFWTERFESEGLPSVTLEVCWAWTDEKGQWTAAEDARTDYFTEPCIYKIYLTRVVSPGDDDKDPIGRFLTAMAPLTREALAK